LHILCYKIYLCLILKACLAKCATCNNTTGVCVTCADSTHRNAALGCACNGTYYGVDTDAACTGII
jgi:hypothetical protein